MRRYFLLSMLASLILPAYGLAQTGLPPFGSIDQIGLEHRNNQDLNVLFTLPIMSSPGRGVSLNFSLVYNSSIWSRYSSVWAPSTNNAAWGWTTNYGTGNTTYTYSTDQSVCNRHQGDVTYTYTTIYQDYVYTDAVGTPHTLGLYWKEVENDCLGTDITTGTFSSYATDGSGFLGTISISNPFNPGIFSPGGISLGGSILADTNGNYISSTNMGGGETDWTDSAGRVALKVIVGSATILYEYLDPTTGEYLTTTLYLQSLPIKTNFQCSGVIEYTGSASVPSALVFPNHQTYTFTYEPSPGNSGYYTGRLQKVALLAGGYYEYDYTGANDGASCTDGTTVSMNRVVYDGTTSKIWNYVRNVPNRTTTITTPQLADTPNANDMVISFNGSNQEISRVIYKESPGVHALRTVNTTWASNGTPATKTTILDDGSTQSKVATTYDSNGLLDSVSEYNWGTGSPGSLFRTTAYTYQTSTNYTSRNILNLVISKQIKDGSGVVQYRQDTTYDATTGDNQTCPAGIAQHYDQYYPCNFYYRGSPTSVTTYLAPASQGGPITKSFTYDWFGNLLTAQLNCCQNKTWGYSSATTTDNYSEPDSVTSGTSPSLKTTFQYNVYTGQVLSSTDSNGLVTSFSYDSLRRPAGASQASGPSVSFSYDDAHFTSTAKATIDSSKSVQQITALDALGRPYLSTTEDVNNNVISKTSVQYDQAGRAYQSSNPYQSGSPSYWTATAFDVLGRPTSITLPDNSSTSYSYTANTAIVTDPQGIKRESVSDAAGRLSIVWEPDPSNNNNLSLSTSYTYNLLDELTQISQGSQTRTYVYDAFGRLNTATTPEAGTVCFGTYSGSNCLNGYDQFDNLLSRTDARGVVTNYIYDSLNRLLGVTYPTVPSGVSPMPNVCKTTGSSSNNANVCFTYGTSASSHNNGLLVTMADGVGSENYTYSTLEQLTTLQKVIGSSTYTTQYAYNLAGQLTSLTYPSGRVVQQSVDAIGRLCEVAPSTTGCGTASSPFATALAYSAAGQMTGFKYGNGIYASFGFSVDRLQLNCLDYSTTNRGGSCIHDGTTKFGLSYSYPSAPSNNGLLSGITDSVDNGRSATYTYDSLYRLLTAKTAGSTNYPAWGLSETYDRYGNRSAQTAIAGTCVSIACPQPSVTISATTNRLVGPPYAYDASGNMTNDGLNTLVYDAENHVTSVTSGSGTGTYTYDGSGQRVKKIGGGNTIVTIFAGAQVLAEYYNGAAPSSPTNEYIYAGSLRVASIQAGATNYWHNDHLSPRVRTDISGNVSDQRATFPFGETWYSPGASPSMFTSYYRDYEAAGDDYAQARTYVGGLGRFSSPDPISGSTSDPQSLNRYSYVRNMPVMLTDPFGTCPGGTAQNRDDNQSQDSQGGGPYASDSADSSDPDPQQGPPPWSGCKGFTDQGGGRGALSGGFGGGGVSIDGGETFDPGDGGWGITGIGTDPFSILNAAFAVTGYETADNPDCPNDDCPRGVGEESITVPVYGNLGLLSLLGGPDSYKPWQMRSSLVKLLRAKNDCSNWFNQGTGSAPDIMSQVPILLRTPTEPYYAMADAWPGGADPQSPISVNSLGRFYTDKYNFNPVGDFPGGGFPAGSFGARATILLHELAHKVNPPGFIANDADTPSASPKNTQMVIDHCFDAIVGAMP